MASLSEFSMDQHILNNVHVGMVMQTKPGTCSVFINYNHTLWLIDYWLWKSGQNEAVTY